MTTATRPALQETRPAALTRTAVHANLQVTEDSSFRVFCSRGTQSAGENVLPGRESKNKRLHANVNLAVTLRKSSSPNPLLPVRVRTDPSQSPTRKRERPRTEQSSAPQSTAVAPRTCGSPCAM